MTKKLQTKKLQERTQVNVFCPRCSPAVKLIVRTNRTNDSQFLACPNWPMCDHSQGLPQDVIMRLQGAIPLPGF